MVVLVREAVEVLVLEVVPVAVAVGVAAGASLATRPVGRAACLWELSAVPVGHTIAMEGSIACWTPLAWRWAVVQMERFVGEVAAVVVSVVPRAVILPLSSMVSPRRLSKTTPTHTALLMSRPTRLQSPRRRSQLLLLASGRLSWSSSLLLLPLRE